eukprot:TRINITY_DN56286_c0_g1_i1.p1 TRINITY_DN56286_c0_g1~~TRINITY_DN56286_c0_g1_i1.p1  ORF type:complete len:219 (+),score=48.87 TRINITY_DN56286_c0_g1_i1:84-740(+)
MAADLSGDEFALPPIPAAGIPSGGVHSSEQRARPRTAAPHHGSGCYSPGSRGAAGSGAMAAASLNSSTMVNARGIVKKAGGLFAVAHPHLKTGYKVDEGSKRLEGCSEYRLAYGPTQGGVYEKKLQKYRPDAMRSRVREPQNESAGRYTASHRARPRSAVVGHPAPTAAGLMFLHEPPNRFSTVNHKVFRAVDPHPTGANNAAIAAFQTRFRRQLMEG